MSIPSLERSLKEYAQNPSDSPFDMKSVPIAAIPTPEEKENKHKSEGMLMSVKPAPVSREENFSEKLASLPGISEFGPLFKTSDVVELTESETEYFVRCIKHCYANHVVLQFDCLNTLSDQLLEDVRVQLDPSEGYSILNVIPCPKLPYNETGTTYVTVKFPENDLPNSVGTFGAILKFIVKDCDPNTGLPDAEEGYDDEYILEDLEITLGDQIQKIHKVNWAAAWEEAASSSIEMEDTYSLSSMSSLEEAVKNIVQFLGLQPAERTDKIPEGKTTHTLLLAGILLNCFFYLIFFFLSGMFRGGIDILVRAKLALADGVTMQLTVRSTDGDVAELITSAVG